jgi:hypothetical protein
MNRFVKLCQWWYHTRPLPVAPGTMDNFPKRAGVNGVKSILSDLPVAIKLAIDSPDAGPDEWSEKAH